MLVDFPDTDTVVSSLAKIYSGMDAMSGKIKLYNG